jgi:short-subunit dehydrogenase
MNIVITGASKGIGFAIAKKFAAHGHHLFLTSKTAADLIKAVDELTQMARHYLPPLPS